MKDKHETFGYLKEDSPLREIFQNGTVPLKHPLECKGKGRDGEKIRFYEVDLEALSEGQVQRVIAGFKTTRKALFKEGYRIQTKHFSRVSFPARLIA